MALWRSWLARRPVTAEVAGSSPVRVAVCGSHPCGGCRFFMSAPRSVDWQVTDSGRIDGGDLGKCCERRSESVTCHRREGWIPPFVGIGYPVRSSEGGNLQVAESGTLRTGGVAARFHCWEGGGERQAGMAGAGGAGGARGAVKNAGWRSCLRSGWKLVILVES